MTKKMLIMLFIISMIMTGCLTQEKNSNTTNLAGTPDNERSLIKEENSNATNEYKTQELFTKLENLYTQFSNVDFSIINCTETNYYEVDVINVSLDIMETDGINTIAKPTRWYPSLNKGYISFFKYDITNLGCKEDILYYQTYVFNSANDLIFSSQVINLDRMDSGYNIYLPRESKQGLLSVSGNDDASKSVVVEKEDTYTTYFVFFNKESDNIVGITKYSVNMSKRI